MLIREVMSSPAITIRPDAMLKSVVQVLDKHGITALPVVDDDGNLVGVVSEADLMRGGIPPDQRLHQRPVSLSVEWFHRVVKDVMTAHPTTVTSTSDLAAAVDLMAETRLKSLPVVDGGTLVGMLSRRDVIRVMSRDDARIQAEVVDLVRAADRDWLVVVDEGVASVRGPETPAEHDLARAVALSVPGVMGVHIEPTGPGQGS